jgi:hypothetical protein
MAGSDPSSRWTDAQLDSMRELGDPEADGPVATVLERGDVDAVNAIMRTLVSNDQVVPYGLPEEIQAYLAKTLTLPDWADPAKIKRGQQLFETWGVQITLCLFCAALPSAYAAAKGVKVLYLTARLDTDARRRVMETAQFLIDVLAVGGLDEHGKGLRTIQRVRLMHAAVRHLIKARNTQQPGLWDPNWGTPINQEDLAGTLLTFSYVVNDSLRRLGVHLPAKDVDAYLHLWNVVGHLLGVHDKLLADDIGDATALVDAIRRRQFKASPEGQDMTNALLKLLDDMTPFHRFDETIPPLIRHLIGEETADLLLVPKSDLVDDLGRLEHLSNWVYVRIFGRTERDSPRYQRVSRLIRPFGYDLLHGLFRLERGGQRAPFDVPQHLARSWELSA